MEPIPARVRLVYEVTDVRLFRAYMSAVAPHEVNDHDRLVALACQGHRPDPAINGVTVTVEGP
jgi:hypothetical protein